LYNHNEKTAGRPDWGGKKQKKQKNSRLSGGLPELFNQAFVF